MNKVTLFGILLVTSIFAQDVDLTRGQFWGRITVAPQFGNGFSGVVAAGLRNNFSITKTVSGTEKDVPLQGNWLNELYLGMGWKHKVFNRSVFSTQLLYRPQFWYSDGTGGTSYLRNTVMLSGNLVHTLKPFKIHQRLMFWGSLENEKMDLDNELTLRYLVGPVVPFGKKLDLSVKAEPFFKLTADDSDLDGTELFYRMYTWAGLDLKPTRGVKLSLNYVWMNIFKTENITIHDHYIYAHVVLSPKWN